MTAPPATASTSTPPVATFTEADTTPGTASMLTSTFCTQDAQKMPSISAVSLSVSTP